jgi:hypothetical protein
MTEQPAYAAGGSVVLAIGPAYQRRVGGPGGPGGWWIVERLDVGGEGAVRGPGSNLVYTSEAEGRSGGAGALEGGPRDQEEICLPSGDTYAGAGGAGGGVGRIRLSTAMGARGCICAGSFSPAATFGTL